MNQLSVQKPEPRSLHLFEAIGVELEYMIVRDDTLDVFPFSDRVFQEETGAQTDEVERGELAWNNELVLHVIELKTNKPAKTLDAVRRRFAEEISYINKSLLPHRARLLPTGMHPWMNPEHETRLWPHDNHVIYESFHRIFDCRGHGWSNLQSTHINLPFSGAEEFGRLHAAIRLILPIIPALAASTPIFNGIARDTRDSRLAFYVRNQARLPIVAGSIIPEPVFDPNEYHDTILDAIYRALVPHDPKGILQNEWINSRGAIPRFSRGTIEIRLIDAQESPRADFAVVAAVVAAVRMLVEEQTISWSDQKRFAVAPMKAILDRTITAAEAAPIEDSAYLNALTGSSAPRTAGAVWRNLIERSATDFASDDAAALEAYLQHGTLASRIFRRLGDKPNGGGVYATYRELAICLEQNAIFRSEGSKPFHEERLLPAASDRRTIRARDSA